MSGSYGGSARILFMKGWWGRGHDTNIFMLEAREGTKIYESIIKKKIHTTLILVFLFKKCTGSF